VSRRPTWGPAAEQVVDLCRRLWQRGLVAGADGNVSVRVAADAVLITPSGRSKGALQADELVLLSLGGEVLEGNGRPSSECDLHLRAYAARPDIHAVVHAHPRMATALTLSGETLPDALLPEITVLLGPVPLVPYATPGTSAVADAFAPYWEAHEAFLMAHHGALTLGADLEEAHQRMESLEHAAGIVVAARSQGPLRSLSAEEVAILHQMRAARRASRRLH
jgi:L-fuculose-phosphate aldolase